MHNRLGRRGSLDNLRGQYQGIDVDHRVPRPRSRRPSRDLFGSSHRALARSDVPGYQVIKKMSTGGMSEAINLVRDRSGRLFIEKRVRASGYRRIRAKAELNALQRARGDNMNHLIAHIWNPNGSCAFILEYCNAGILEDQIELYRTRSHGVSEDFALYVATGVANALAFLHEGIRDALRDSRVPGWNTIMHLDLKPCNIFLSATRQRGQHPRKQQAGTLAWYPPETLPHQRNTRYGIESDVWQLGALLHALCLLLDFPHRGKLSTIYSCGNRYGALLNGIVARCVRYDWRAQYSAAMIVRFIAMNTGRTRR